MPIVTPHTRNDCCIEKIVNTVNATGWLKLCAVHAEYIVLQQRHRVLAKLKFAAEHPSARLEHTLLYGNLAVWSRADCMLMGVAQKSTEKFDKSEVDHSLRYKNYIEPPIEPPPQGPPLEHMRRRRLPAASIHLQLTASTTCTPLERKNMHTSECSERPVLSVLLNIARKMRRETPTVRRAFDK